MLQLFSLRWLPASALCNMGSGRYRWSSVMNNFNIEISLIRPQGSLYARACMHCYNTCNYICEREPCQPMTHYSKNRECQFPSHPEQKLNRCLELWGLLQQLVFSQLQLLFFPFQHHEPFSVPPDWQRENISDTIKEIRSFIRSTIIAWKLSSTSKEIPIRAVIGIRAQKRYSSNMFYNLFWYICWKTRLWFSFKSWSSNRSSLRFRWSSLDLSSFSLQKWCHNVEREREGERWQEDEQISPCCGCLRGKWTSKLLSNTLLFLIWGREKNKQNANLMIGWKWSFWKPKKVTLEPFFLNSCHVIQAQARRWPNKYCGKT